MSGTNDLQKSVKVKLKAREFQRYKADCAHRAVTMSEDMAALIRKHRLQTPPGSNGNNGTSSES